MQFPREGDVKVNWLDILFGVILVFFALDGLRKGLVATIFSLTGSIASICIAAYYHPDVANYLDLNYNMLNKIQEVVYGKVKLPVEAAGLQLTNTTQEAIEQLLINMQLPLPIRNVIMENSQNLSEFTAQGVETIGQYLSLVISQALLTAISFILILCAVKLLFLIILFILNKLIDSGYMGFSNRMLGICAGLAQGILASMILLTFVVPILPGGVSAVDRSVIASVISKYNFIPALISYAFPKVAL